MTPKNDNKTAAEEFAEEVGAKLTYLADHTDGIYLLIAADGSLVDVVDVNEGADDGIEK